MGATVPKVECLDGILPSPARGVGGEWGAAMFMQYHTLSKPPSGTLGALLGELTVHKQMTMITMHNCYSIHPASSAVNPTKDDQPTMGIIF